MNFTDEMIIEIRKRCAQGEDIRKLSEEYKIDRKSVWRAAIGKTYKHIPMTPIIYKHNLRPIPSLISYMADDEGNIYSIIKMKRYPRKLSQFLRNGYLVIGINNKKHLVHRLICEAFNGPPPDGTECCRHLNDVKTDNNPKNLSWGTRKDNIDDAYKNNRIPHGENHVGTKLTNNDVIDIRQSEMTVKKLADKYGVKPGTIYKIRSGERWKYFQNNQQQNT